MVGGRTTRREAATKARRKIEILPGGTMLVRFPLVRKNET